MARLREPVAEKTLFAVTESDTQFLQSARVTLAISEAAAKVVLLDRSFFEGQIPINNLHQLLGYLETVGFVPQSEGITLPLAEKTRVLAPDSGGIA